MLAPSQDMEDIASYYAWTTFLISTFGACIFMVFIQCLLYKVYRSSYKVNSPTPLELYLIVAVLWLVYHGIDTLLSVILDTLILVVSPRRTFDAYQVLRNQSYDYSYWTGASSDSSSLWSVARLLCHEVFLTWLISQTLVTFVDKLRPLLSDLQHSPSQIFTQVHKRLHELLSFFQSLTQKTTFRTPRLDRAYTDPYDQRRSNARLVDLRRYHEHDLHDHGGQRILNWDLTVDRAALNEMKETLGPTGGFGELGFSVEGERICFGAMGTGTRFNLTVAVGRWNMESGKRGKRRKSR